MKVLYVTNMFPTPANPVFGIFIKEQVDAISSKGVIDYEVYFINKKKGNNLQYLLSCFCIPFKLMLRKFDIVHIHYGLSGLFLLLYKPLMPRIFLTLHGADILKEQGRYVQVFLTKRILKKIDKAFILNDEMEKIVKRLKINYEILPCGLDINFFTITDTRESEGNKKLILFPGNPEINVKNYPLFKKVIQTLMNHGDYKIECKCINNLSREGVRDLLNAADCILMTSLSEGSPQVIKEALSCGLPVVSVPVGDVRTLTDNVPHCYISNSYSHEELASLVLKAFTGKGYEIRNAFIHKNRYDSDSIAMRIINNYRSLTRGSSNNKH